MSELPANGKMAAVLAGAADVEALLPPVQGEDGGAVVIAALNGPKSVVISGVAEAVDELLRTLSSKGIGAQPLSVSQAFHSSLIEPMLEPFRAFAEQFDFHPLRIPMVSNVSGRLLEPAERLDADYWVRHARQPVRFSEGAAALEKSGTRMFLEIGPAPQLIGLGKTVITDKSCAWVGSLKPANDDWKMLADSLATLWVHGAALDWERFDRPYRRSRRTIPNYAFERQRYWMDPPDGLATGKFATAASNNGHAVGHPLLGTRIRSAAEALQFEAEISLGRLAWLGDHRIHTTAVMPAAAYLEAAFEAIRESERASGQLQNVRFHEALVLAEDNSRVVQLLLAPELAGQSAFQIYSHRPSGNGHPDGRWTLHVSGSVVRSRAKIDAEHRISISDIRNRCPDSVNVESFYRQLAAAGLRYGPSFQGVANLWCGDGEAVGEVRPPESVEGQVSQFEIHPALLDSAFHVLAAAIAVSGQETYLPVAVKSAKLLSKPAGTLTVHAIAKRAAADALAGDIALYDGEGRAVAEIFGLKLQRLPTNRLAGEPNSSAQSAADLCYRLRWDRQPLPDNPPERPWENSRPWLIVGDERGVGQHLAELLEIHGVSCLFAGDAGQDFNLRQSLIDGGFDPDAGVAMAVYLQSLDAAETLPSEDAGLLGALTDQVDRIAALVRELSRFQKPSQLVIVTRQCQPVVADEAIALSQSPIVGLFRTIVVEHPEFRALHIDLDASCETQAAAEILANEFADPDGEDQIAWRTDQRWVLRLERIDDDESTAKSDQDFTRVAATAPQFRLEAGRSGMLDGLRLRVRDRVQPPVDSVEIEVQAAGLNFSDVLKAMQLYPGVTDDTVPLGIECAGIVSAVGEGCREWSVGDEVMALAPYCFARTVHCPDYGLIRKPAGLGFAEAATLPVAYLTAHYALIHLARLSKGESILIHTAAGGVGQAAIVIARQLGAELFATAGSSGKREFLKSQGVQHVFDSRSLQFADDIRQTTNGRGVDVVLNSVAGEAMTESLRLLAPFGRFLELGKIDIYQNRPVGLEPFQNNLSYFAIDMDRMYRQAPEKIRQLTEELSERFASGTYRPLHYKEFPLTDAVAAFRYMSQRKNIGKVILSMSPPQADAASSTTGAIRPEVTYLITGGAGGLGLQLAQWLTTKGATSLAVCGRGAPSEAAQRVMQDLEGRGVQVRYFSADVSRADDVRRLIREITDALSPLAGVFHLAGMLDDGVILRQSRERWERALGPKAAGAWHLHQATLGLPLDLFVCFSSAASLLGSGGQANYAAANAFLDGMAHARRQAGLPALAVNWGAWATPGMADTAVRRNEIANRGFAFIDPGVAFSALERWMKLGDPQIAVMSVDWSVALKPFQKRIPPMVRDFAADRDSSVPAAANLAAFPADFHKLPPEEQAKLLTEHFQQRLVEVTGLDPDRIDPEQPLNALGLDSLMIFELKNSIENQLQITIPVARLFENPSLLQLARWSLELMTPAEGSRDQNAREFVSAPAANA